MVKTIFVLGAVVGCVIGEFVTGHVLLATMIGGIIGYLLGEFTDLEKLGRRADIAIAKLMDKF